MELQDKKLYFVPLEEIRRIRKEIADPFSLCEILADIVRLNALYMIANAGSGHIGSSFSSTDIVTWLWTQEMESPNQKNKDVSDVYFSSKGHDVPALYSLLIALEKLDFDLMHKLRRLGGLPGHPDVGTPYIATNTGSLGMGISKARGMALANRLNGKSGHIYVMTGDGELQEGQIWEALQPCANHKFSEITVIVDHNKMQTNSLVEDISDLGKLENKFRSFGWEVARCNGHNFRALQKVFSHFKKIKNRPQVLIADTVKGKGISFMESTSPKNRKYYKYHSGAPNSEEYLAGFDELSKRINSKLEKLGKKSLKFKSVKAPEPNIPKNPERLVDAYGDELVKIAKERKDIVVLDADLLPDCGIASFKEKFSERFFECGIAEQDMVSMAGGLALKGMLPIAHSFACFLSTRPNEQIYNNSTEKTKIIYVGTLAGLLPAAPGHSHQSVRDISALGAMPGLTIIEPCNEREARMAIRWAVEKNPKSAYLRFSSIRLELPYKLPEDYKLEKGRGVFLKQGRDAVIISYGPVMLSEAIKAAEILEKKKVSTAVINLPWLNKIDDKWLKKLNNYKLLVVLDDHYINQGQGELIASILGKTAAKHPKFVSLGIREIPVCGHKNEVLEHHLLDGTSIVKIILNLYLAL